MIFTFHSLFSDGLYDSRIIDDIYVSFSVSDCLYDSCIIDDIYVSFSVFRLSV